MITYCCLLFSPTYAAANICWGMLLSIFYIAFYLRRWASGGVLCLLLIAEFLEMKLMEGSIDAFVGFASEDLFVFCIGILLATTERTAQAKQMEHNLRIASHLHSAVTSELSSIILMARSGSKDDGTLERIETVARLSLANMHSIIRTLSDTGNADTDESRLCTSSGSQCTVDGVHGASIYSIGLLPRLQQPIHADTTMHQGVVCQYHSPHGKEWRRIQHHHQRFRKQHPHHRDQSLIGQSQ